MVKVLIPSKPDDTHTVYVKLALEKKGHHAAIWYTSDFPERQVHSFHVRQDHISWQSKGLDFAVQESEEFDVVWLRRPRKPVLPAFLHPDDKENANYENCMLFQSFWKIISPKALWVNAIDSAKSANSKLLQLKVATAVGLTIPETLVSNDPHEIREFINKQQGEVIYKTLFPAIWIKKNEMRLTYTREITESDLPKDTVLQSTPCIFQKKIVKAYELRVTFFGNKAITAKLRSQEHPKGKMDWRYVPPHQLIIEEYSLPNAIYEKCKALMKKLNLVFGCIDFIVTPDNEYYFLEINEQGQFLWIEDANPQIKMLDNFTDFLISKDSNYAGSVQHNDIILSDYTFRVKQVIKSAMSKHITPSTYY